MNFGGVDVQKAQLGELEIKKIYLGAQLIWEEEDDIVRENLLQGTTDFSGNWTNRHTWTLEPETYEGLTVYSKANPWGGLGQSLELEPGTYRFSLYARATAPLDAYMFSSNARTSIDPWNYTLPLTTEWTRFSRNFVVTATSTSFFKLEKSSSDEIRFFVAGFELVKL